ncbi:2-amino-4-hydroxy-6-hydroxymethyldihydropteridine diphosphokinase [Congregibacter litoralis]|uniref:2-amino-4-hydroxy-6-hydroxymethyldihydropteridine pyrophosphokinase n=1 Tax=Congregibacter litoralis KT71 TaxID=314285 RepID=A4AA00_9GAMM|nr:2-amino-4-hydroxy-6-hydroxymethyldihydropteridine diphosphokinase [Congregibacter litoralis]EAQ97317.1 2-amino-4-hydroxy-6-hydroxymethyldihydropteridine pyrophosphokinase [Congregibacter litoralis KT71]
MTACFVGLGANLGESHATLIRAAQDLGQLRATQLTGRSSIYRSAPMGPQDQPDYLNAVIGLDTALKPLELLDELQSLEDKAGRVRRERWGPRTLDLDLLIYGTITLQSERLTLPHPGLFERNFVLRPLADIVSEHWQFQGGPTLAACLKRCPESNLRDSNLPWSPLASKALSA